MGLFGLKKKKHTEEKVHACSCQRGCHAAETNITETEKKRTDTAACTLSIKVLGTGCASCHALLESTKQAVVSMGLYAEVEYVTDMAQIAGYGVMRMPALVVNGNPVAMGKTLKPEEVEEILKKTYS
ncbi:thioredoxin family protein [Candidatus Agathobaculum pullicola]|uniref:thioredoxin family protein n=1 Tax=Candidatus Agathobaculum pullicola TaxID=2838426 RepID=UPI003F92DDEA